MGHLRSPRPPPHTHSENFEEVRKDVFRHAPERAQRTGRRAVTQPRSWESLLQFQSSVNTAALLTARRSDCATERKDAQEIRDHRAAALRRTALSCVQFEGM